MAERARLSRLKLPQRYLSKLNNSGILTAKDLFRYNSLELTEMGFFPDEIKELLHIVSDAIAAKPQQVSTMLINEKEKKTLQLGRVEGNSLSIIPGLTELVGGAGMGKTQACLTLAVQAAVSNATHLHQAHVRFGAVVYIDSETAFSPSRLVEIAQNSYPGIFHNDATINKLMSSVIVFTESSTSKLAKRVAGLEQTIISKGVKLIIVDSIANPVRGEFGKQKLPQRQKILSQLASGLKYTGDTFHIPIVVTNQILAYYDGAAQTAALGISWAHAVNTRFVLQKREHDQNGSVDDVRMITVKKSPRFPQISFPYTITQGGFTLLDNPELSAMAL